MEFKVFDRVTYAGETPLEYPRETGDQKQTEKEVIQGTQGTVTEIHDDGVAVRFDGRTLDAVCKPDEIEPYTGDGFDSNQERQLRQRLSSYAVDNRRKEQEIKTLKAQVKQPPPMNEVETIRKENESLRRELAQLQQSQAEGYGFETKTNVNLEVFVRFRRAGYEVFDRAIENGKQTVTFFKEPSEPTSLGIAAAPPEPEPRTDLGRTLQATRRTGQKLTTDDLMEFARKEQIQVARNDLGFKTPADSITLSASNVRKVNHDDQ